MIKIFLYKLSAYPKRIYKRSKKFFKNNILKKSDIKEIKPYLFDDKPIGDIFFLLYDLKLRGFECSHILDVGAHSAVWARTAKKVFPDAVIYLIEPLKELESNLRKFTEDYPSSKYFLNGAGSKEETLYMTVSEALEGANFLQEENIYLKNSSVQREIKIITIDSLIQKKEIEIPQLVKMDIQGFELEALKGADLLFGKTEAFILEASFYEFIKGTPLVSEVITFMSDKGYELYDFAGFLRRPYDRALGQMDICFARKNGFLRSSDNWRKL